MPEFDRWVQRYVRRISVGEFLRDAAEWLAGFCFVFGVAVLAVKLRWPNLWPHVLWLVAASVPATGVAWWLSRRRRLSRQDAVAMLDQKLAAGGLLMTLSELPGGVEGAIAATRIFVAASVADVASRAIRKGTDPAGHFRGGDMPCAAP